MVALVFLIVVHVLVTGIAVAFALFLNQAVGYSPAQPESVPVLLKGSPPATLRDGCLVFLLGHSSGTS